MKPENSEIIISIDHIGGGGDGVAQHGGARVFVAKTAPGDAVKIQPGKQTGEGFAAKLVHIEQEGPARKAAPCVYFDPFAANCGGCSLQHVTQQFYQDWKAAKIKIALERAGIKVGEFAAPVFLPAATRSRASLAAVKKNGRVIFGYHEARTHNIRNIEHCLILNPALDSKIQALRPYLQRLLPDNKPAGIMLQQIDGTFEIVLTGDLKSKGKFTYDQDDAIASLAQAQDIARVSWRKKDVHTPEPVLTRRNPAKRCGPLSVEIPPGAFLQASLEGEAALLTIVKTATKGATKIADLFCGSGTFAGPLLNNATIILAADGDGPAIAALSKAAQGHKNFTALRRDLFKKPLSADELSAFHAVIFDPPRAGASAQAAQIAQSTVPLVVGISCNPATFARDAAILQNGGYMLKSLTLIDQFVYSAHVELAAVFTR